MKNKIPDFHFENDNHVSAYLYYLIAENLTYHFDDDIYEIKWSIDLSMNDKAILSGNHTRLLKYCDPWEWFNKHPEIWALYRDENPQPIKIKDIKLNTIVTSNERESWIAIVYEAIDNLAIDFNESSQDDLNTALAWLAEEVGITDIGKFLEERGL